MASSGKGQTLDPRLSADAKEFVPRFAAPQESYAAAEYLEPAFQDSISIQDYLNDSLASIATDPAAFEIYAEDLLAFLNTVSIPDEQTLHLIVDIIFNFGLVEPNFRYTGARLCNFLSQRLNVSFGIKNFRYLLLQRCSTEFKNVKETVVSDSALTQNFAYFLAELFVHLNLQAGHLNSRIAVLAKAVPEVLELLLRVPSPENVKCVTQVFKLCGALIDDEERSVNRGQTPLMDRVFSSLLATAANESLPPQSRRMLRDIADLRVVDWGRAACAAAASNVPASEEPGKLIPSFTLTAEEEAFLASQNLSPYQEQEDDWYDETGIDPEMEAEFEKFLADGDS